MDLSFFIARRFRNKSQKSFSKTVSILSIISIALGLLILNLSHWILAGFQEKIEEKIFTIDGHIEVSFVDENQQYNVRPISTKSNLYNCVDQSKHLERIYAFTEKEGIMQYNQTVHGIKLRGVNEDFNFNHFSENFLDSGKVLSFKDSSEVLLPLPIAQKLKAKVGDTILVNFFENKRPRYRHVKVQGIFETGLENIDDRLVIGDYRLLNELNKWEDDQVGGFAVFVKPGHDVNIDAGKEVLDEMGMEMEYEFIADKYIQVFDWLNIIPQNIQFVIFIVAVIVLFSILAAVFILILEKTSAVGTLKALGATNFMIGKVFWILISRVTLTGVVIGNVLTLLFTWLQNSFKMIPLDQANYYIDYVPISYDWDAFLFVNLYLILGIIVIEILPILAILRIKPINSIKFN